MTLCCRRLWLVVVDFILSSVISASLMLLSCFGGNYVVGDGSVLLCFCELSREGKEKENDELWPLMIVLKITR